MGDINLFTSLAIALLLALLSSKIMKKIKLPNVTGYLIVGLLAGPYCFKFLSTDFIHQLSIIPDIALGLIAFSIGAEFKLSYLKKVGKAPIVIALAEGLGATLLVDLVLILTGHDIAFSIILGAIASATAPAATLMVIRQYKAKGPVTNMLLPVVAIDDAVAIIAFGISVAIAKSIKSPEGISIAGTLIEPAIEIFGAIIFGSILGVILKFLTKWFTGRGNRLSVVIAMLFLCIGVSKVFGFSSLMACMAMSAIYVNLSEASDQVFEQVDRFTPPLFMMFFFLSGADLDISVLPSVGLIGLIYVVVRVIGKVLGAAIGSQITKVEPVIKKYLGFTLMPQAGVAIGLTTIAMEVVPEYGTQIRTIILCGTVIYELIGPVVTKISLKKAGEIQVGN